MAKNKVVYGGQTIIDLTDTTAEASDVASGKYFYDKAGVRTEGTASGGGAIVITDTTDAGGGTIREITAVDISDTTATASDVVSGKYFYAADGTKTAGTIGTGTEGTPTASKGAVSNHSVTVTPSVTNVGGVISGGTHTGTGVTVSASELVSGTKSISANGQGIDVTEFAAVNVAVPAPSLQTITKNYTPTESAQSETITAGAGYDGIEEVDVTVAAISNTYVGSGVARKSSSDLTSSGATVTAPAGYYENAATKTVSSGSATPPSTISGTSASVSTGTNTLTLSKTVSVTPSVSAGYVSSGTAGNVAVSLTATVSTQAAQTIYPSASDQTINSGRYLTGNQTIKGVTTANLTAENIKNGVTVTVGDSADADRILSVTGTYSGGGSSVQYATKTATASNYPVSLQFTGLSGEPKAFVVRLNASVSSSGSTTYYYIVDIAAFGTTTHGNCFRIGSTRQVTSITSGYSWSYSGTTLTVTSSAASRSASPGAFYSGSYELLYAY